MNAGDVLVDILVVEFHVVLLCPFNIRSKKDLFKIYSQNNLIYLIPSFTTDIYDSLG